MNSQDFLDKKKIALSFSRSAETYDQFSQLQKSLAKELARSVGSLKISPKDILDVGTGTGEVTFLLHEQFKDARITGCDIAPGMIEKASQKNRSKNMKFEIADAEKLPYESDHFDLVVSSTTYQWVEDIEKAFSEAKRVLKKNGYFAFITFGPESLIELKKSFKFTVDETAEYLHEYKTVGEISAILEGCGFKVDKIVSRLVRSVYSDFKDMFRTIKGIGALNATTKLPGGLRGRSKIKSLIKYYESNYRLDGSIYATYEVIEAVCVKT
jgi:malonyl-CoA O-methyltransferase